MSCWFDNKKRLGGKKKSMNPPFSKKRETVKSVKERSQLILWRA